MLTAQSDPHSTFGCETDSSAFGFNAGLMKVSLFKTSSNFSCSEQRLAKKSAVSIWPRCHVRGSDPSQGLLFRKWP